MIYAVPTFFPVTIYNEDICTPVVFHFYNNPLATHLFFLSDIINQCSRHGFFFFFCLHNLWGLQPNLFHGECIVIHLGHGLVKAPFSICYYCCLAVQISREHRFFFFFFLPQGAWLSRVNRGFCLFCILRGQQWDKRESSVRAEDCLKNTNSVAWFILLPVCYHSHSKATKLEM